MTSILLALAGLAVIALCIAVPIWLGERAWKRGFEEKVDEMEDRDSFKDYRL